MATTEMEPTALPPVQRTHLSKTTFDVGTRQSQLALVQTDMVINALKNAWPGHKFEIHARNTAAGDIDKVTAFKDMPVKNIWTHELETLLIEKTLDVLVHSLKDVPTQLPPSCAIGPVMLREDPRDALVLRSGLPPSTLASLPAGSVIGTSSIRRTAQIALKYPHLIVRDMRGNVPTRLRKLDAEDSGYTAIILAAAGLLRLDLGHRITKYLSNEEGGMMYAVGQGAIGIELRSDDQDTKRLLAEIGDEPTTLACLAERSLLRKLEGGCSAPLGVETEWTQNTEGQRILRLRAIVVSVDGTQSAEISKDGIVNSVHEAEEFGVTAAEDLVKEGAGAILEVINQTKKVPTDLTEV